MKFSFQNSLLNAIILASSLFVLTACGDDDDDAPATTSNNTATAMIDGVAFTSTSLDASTEDFFGIQMINLNYLNQAGDTIQLGIDGTANAGQQYHYEVEGTNAELDFTLNYIKADGTEYIPFSGTSGHLTVTTHDKNARVIKGTFMGKLKTFGFDADSVNITGGNFEGKY